VKKGTSTKTASALSGAAAMAAIPPSLGCLDWRIIAGSAAAGAVAGWFGVDLAKKVKGMRASAKGIQ